MTKLCPRCGADISHSYEAGEGWYCHVCDEAWTLEDEREERGNWLADRRKDRDGL